MDSISLIDTIKANTPDSIRRLSRRMKQWVKDRRNRAVPVGDVFTAIYEQRLWGSDRTMNFYSGPGSSPQAAKPYCDFVKTFIRQHDIGSVVDLGCGDFRVGAMIAPACRRYTGADVVEKLVAENRLRHGSDSVSFECLDITKDALPAGELCLIREVFQHLSNAQISAVLKRIRVYPHVLFTDAQPVDPSRFRINRDKIHGASSRLFYGSVLQLDRPPFSLSGVTQVLETDVPLLRDSAPFGTSFKLRTFLLSH